MIRKPRSSSQRRRPRANPSEATKTKSQNLKKNLKVISPRRSPPRTSADDHDADHASQKPKVLALKRSKSLMKKKPAMLPLPTSKQLQLVNVAVDAVVLP